MASKKKKKKISEQIISGTYESSLSKNKVSSALKSNNKSITNANSQKDTLFSAFDDGYNFGDISRTILKGASKINPFDPTELGRDAGTVFGIDPVGTVKSIGSGIKEGAVNVKDKAVSVGKEVVKDPIGSLKAGGVGILGGIDKADTLINNATDDFLDWIVPGREEKDKGLTLKEFNQLSSATDEKTKKKLLKEYAEKYGEDSSTYKTIKLQLETDPEEVDALNWKYTDSDTYKDLQSGELSKGKQTVYETGETIGQMLPSVAVSSVAGPVAGTGVFFTQTQQSYTEQALADGYTESDARKYGMIMGTAEVVVERLGFDELGGLDKLASYSIKKAMIGEGAEEFVMPYIDSTVKTLGFGEEFDVEGTVAESIEGAVMGATVGVIMNAGGRGLQSVDKVIQKAQNGQEISQDELLQATKEIEENYPELLEEAMAVVPEVVQQEIQNESINVVPGTEQDDIAPVQETIDTTEIDEIAPVVAKEVLNPTLVSGQDVRVAGQQDIAPVEAPVQENRYVYTPQETDSQYKQAVSKSAETVGLENNASTQTMIDLATKVSERTGKQILFTNDSQPEMLAKRKGLIESYARSNNISVAEANEVLKGTTINGLTDGDTILINTDSNGYLNVIVGHEITHTFENLGKLYNDLQDAVFKYASERGEFEEISDRISRIYEGQNANLNQELTSELVGRYLFTDQAFIDSLKAKKPNVFQRMYNEIKHLIKMATAGSPEARALEEVKYRFEKAMNKVASDETSKATVQETKDKSTTERLSNKQNEEFSLQKDNLGRELSEEQIEFFKDSKIRDENGNLLTVYHGTKSEFFTFDISKAGDNYENGWSQSGTGFYFTEDIKEAQDFGDYSLGEKDTEIKEVYLNITNPFDTSTTDASVLEKLSEGYGVNKHDLTRGDFLLRWFRNNDVNASEVLQKNGYDGIIDFGHYVAYEPNQIKDVDNKKPTLDEDIRYSLSKNESVSLMDKELDKQRVGLALDRISEPVDIGTIKTPKGKELSLKSQEINLSSPYVGDRYVRKITATDTEGNEAILSFYTDKQDLVIKHIEGAVRGDGSGTTLLNQIIEEAKENGITRIIADDTTHWGASAYWEKQGFVSNGEGDHILDLTESEDIRYSLSDNKGYHYGDLGKARDTNYFSMSNTRRSTGHFGTGTYFVGSKDSNVGSLKEGRQVHEVEFTDYDLFKPKNSIEAEQLHSLLKDINNGELNAFKLEDAEKLFNKSYEELYEAYKNTTTKAEEYKKLDDFTQLETDSLSTVFMKELGYNGIDVRGIEGFDNGTYGSVIYDLDNKTNNDYEKYISATNEALEKAKAVSEEFYNDMKTQQQEYRDRHQLEYDILEKTASRPATNENINSDFFKEHRSEYDENRGIKTADGILTVMHLQKGDNLAKLSFTEGTDKIWIDELYVKNQKQGYGSEIVNAIKQYAEENGKYVEAFKELSTAKGFWDKTLRNDTKYSQTDDPDIRYSLSTDNQGNEIKPAVQKWSEKSQARDENGQLKVLYHGTATGEFTVFDKNMASPEGDWGAGFYLTDNEYDVETNYADGGGDFDGKIAKRAEQIREATGWNEETGEYEIEYEDALDQAREELYKGYYRVDAYVNMENPATVGKTYLFSDYSDNYNMEDFESEEEYYEAVDQLVADDIDTAMWEVQNAYDISSYDLEDIKNTMWEAYANGGMEIQKFKDEINGLYIVDDGNLVGNDITRTIIESLGYDGIIDPTVSSKFKGMSLDEGTTHYIVFKPNQIKNISNENPTDNPDINMSLSKEGEELAPIGDFNIKGSDVRLQKQVEEAIAPLKEEIETLTKTITDLQENIAPASFESAEEQRAETQRTMTDEDAPLTDDGEFIFTEDVPLKGKGKDNITREIANDFDIKYTEARELYNKVANTENPTVEDVFDILKDYRDVKTQVELDEVNAIQHTIKGTRIDVSEFKNQITDYKHYRISNMGKGLILGNSGEKVDSVYQELNEMYGDNAFPLSVTAEVDQLDVISQWLYKEPYLEYTDTIDDDSLYDLAERILSDVGNTERYRTAEAYRTNWFRHYKDDILAPGEEPRIKTEISQEDYLKSLPDALTDDYAPYLEVAREVNASNTENTSENVSIADELSRLSINPQEEVNEAQNEAKYEIERPLDDPLFDFLDNIKRTASQKQAPRVTKEKPGLKSTFGTVQELIFNDTYEIDKLAKETNRPSIKHNNYMLKGVHGEMQGDILVGQTDNYGNVIGKSVKDLWQPAHESGLFEQFNDRMKHQLNIERWKTNKPLWFEIPAEASKEIVKAYDETYPQFKEWADDIYNFYANSLDNKIEAGLANEAQRKLMREELYPSYVRIDVEQLEKPYVDITPGEIRSKTPFKRAVGGSGESAMSLEESMIKSVYADKMGIRQNKLYLEIAKALESSRAEVGADVRQDLADMSEALYLDADTGQYYLTAYDNGEQFTVEIDKPLYDGLKNDLKQTLKNIETKLGKPIELVQKAGNLKRDLTTTYNPFFWLTNPPKDLFDGLINSKNIAGFIKNYPIAVKEAITNTGDAPQFRALYGSAMDMGDYASDSGVGDTDSKFTKKLKNTKLLRGINKLNEITEVVTRLAEFKASKEAGASIEEAMYNAREVTVNFDRGGTLTKFLDRNGFKFLNVSAQGFDKFIRNFSGQEGARATMGAWARALAFGIAPALINHLLFGGDDDEEKDEDYEALPDYIKDNYFLFKMDNGEFVRIPKGRMMAVFGSAGRRTLEFLGGEEDAYEGFFENSESQVGMANPFDNFLLAPLFQAYGSEEGTTWYGEDLIPSRLQDKAPEEQYDASTDKLSIFLGEMFGISPYKLNYVIDQYTGGIGDLVLPMITEETKTDGSLLAPFIDKFTANSTDDNKYASEIYSLGDERDKVPTAEKETDLYKIQDAYLYSITSEMSELYTARREVQADSSLSKSEKYEMVQEIQKQINSLAKEGLDNYQYVSQKENYAIVGGREFNKYTASDGSERWGTPWEDELTDLNSMGMDLGEKNSYFTSKKYITEINDYYGDLLETASDDEKDEIYASRKRDVISAVKDTDLNDEMKAYLYNKYYSSDKTKVITKLGIDFDSYLDFESQQFEADKNSAGKSISGSKKAKVFAYINNMNLDFEERLILAKLQYNSYDTYNAEIINYLNNNSDISYDEEVEILQKLGFTVDANGRIYWD